MQSRAATVADYLASLPEERRAILEAVRNVILENLDGDYSEVMQYGMIGYAVPHSVFQAGYHCDPKQPLPFAGLAAQKNYVSIYLMGLYCCGATEPSAELQWFRDAWAASGKRQPDMGKSCIRFKQLDDIALDVIGEAIRRVPAARYIERYQASLAATPKGSGKKAG